MLVPRSNARKKGSGKGVGAVVDLGNQELHVIYLNYLRAAQGNPAFNVFFDKISVYPSQKVFVVKNPTPLEIPVSFKVWL